MRILMGLSAVFMLTLMSSVAAADEVPGWVQRINFSGDVRLRYEGIDEDGEEERKRMRFRTRFGFKAAVLDEVDFVLRLATGGGNPTSTNQSFDDGFSRKDIGIDRAYVVWRAAEGLEVYAGKMKNPLFAAGRVPLVYDTDLNPEGFALKYSAGAFFSNAAVFTAEERSSSDDSLLYAVQAGFKTALGDAGKLTAGVGYFAYTDTVGNEPFYNGRSRGNTVDANGDYLFEYKNTEVFAQFDTALNDWPLQLYAHYTVNNEVDAEDSGYAFGARIGSAKKQGTQQFSYTYQDIEADAVIGSFNDSDFGGGGTDADGHLLRYRYMMREQIGLGATLFINNTDRYQGIEHDYNRIQLDVEFRFK